ncbi:MAG: DUF3828 domain-containing protein [Acidobacteria bacterium]|nr:DUF3828 domain-containing protein [Acidobacteriota bacterium]
MRLKIVLLIALVLMLSSPGFGQRKRREITPNIVVKNLYAAYKAGSSPFFQTKNRALVDKYFSKKLADLIWKDAVAARGEVGAIDFDPLYGSQDPQITGFVIMDTGWGGDSKYGGADEAVVQVTFKDNGQERMVSYQFKQGRDKSWKIYDIHYRSGGDVIKLVEVLTRATAAPQASEIEGELQVGKAESVILYVGMESGDYAAYCFTNASKAGRAILAACKNGEQCRVSGTVDEGRCRVPGLEADLSASGRISKVSTVKSLGRKK